MPSKNFPSGRPLPPGGSTGDVLTKASTGDQDAAWSPVPAGAQTVSLLGPFDIGHAQVLGTGGNFPILLTALPDGAVVVALSVYVSEAFDATTQMQVDVAPSDDLTNGSDLLLGGNNAGANVATVRSGDPAHYLLPARSSTGSALTIETTIAVAGSSLIAYFGPDIPTVGQLDVYALIATPA